MKAHELLDNPKKWIQNAVARNSEDRIVDSNSNDACCWCMVGAIDKCYPRQKDYSVIYNKLRDHLRNNLDFTEIFMSSWNDAKSRTWEEVHAVLKELDI